jgi:hypothetical protein
MEDRRPGRVCDAAYDEHRIERRRAGRLDEQGEDHAAAQDAAYVLGRRDREDHARDALSQRADGLRQGGPGEGTDRHEAQPAELDQCEDHELADEGEGRGRVHRTSPVVDTAETAMNSASTAATGTCCAAGSDSSAQPSAI